MVIFNFREGYSKVEFPTLVTLSVRGPRAHGLGGRSGQVVDGGVVVGAGVGSVMRRNKQRIQRGLDCQLMLNKRVKIFTVEVISYPGSNLI